MTSLATPLLAAVLLTDFRLLGGSRLVALIRTAGIQGALLGGLAAVEAAPRLDLAAGLAVVTMAVKGLLLPRLLLRAIRRVEIRREVEPLVGYNASLALGVLALGAVAWAARELPLPASEAPALLVSASLFTGLTGLFLVIARRKAILQALGYLVFENGIYGFGLAVAHEEPLLVQLGVLLDLLVAVFVMGIIVFHIQRDFEHIDVDRLAVLRDADPPRGREEGAT
jgi:hydrogenase-4 component E